MDVADWLKTLGLAQYEPLFRDNDISGDLLPSLTADDLKDLGISSVGHRRRMLDAIARLAGDAIESSAATGMPRVPQTPGAPPGERRQVTVLFADLTGYTQLSSQLDAEEIQAILTAFFELADVAVVEHGGSVDKHIGDCVMGVFGAPVAHGNDAERAVHAALAIRDAMPALCRRLGHAIGVHIGVASGEVVASPVGSASHKPYTVTGDSVNLASRLTDRAQSGEVLLSSAVYRALRDRLECSDAGEIEVKGLTQPVPAWRVISARRMPSGERAFVGRQGELRQLAAAIAGCLETRHGRIIHLRGEAGIGKTRLIEELQRMAQANGFACHSGLVLDFGGGTGRDAVRAIIRSILVPPGVEPAAPDSTRDWAREAVDAGQVAADCAVFLYDLLNLPPPLELRALCDAMDNATRARGIWNTIIQVVAGASRTCPLLIVVEDVHWADHSVLERISALAEAAIDNPVLAVLTSRIEGDPVARGWRPAGPILTMDLAPLHRDEALALAQRFYQATSAFAVRCVERAAGNPLFLDQLLREAEDRAESHVPDTVQSLVQARIDRLETSDKQVLQSASVFGQRFSLAALRMVLASPAYDPRALVAHSLVRPQGDELLFGHALIRDAVYATLLRARRRELHQRAASWFAERDLALCAEHLDRAEDPGAPQAYLAAARAQAGQYRYEQALALVERGAALAREPGDRFALACYRGELLHDVGAMTEARAAYEEALAQSSEDAERCRAWLGLAAVNRMTDHLDAALADVERAEAVAARLMLTAEAARAHFLHLLFPRGDLDGCLREHQRSLELAQQAGSAELEAAALGGLGDAEYMRGRMLSAHERFRRCVELCQRHGFGRIEVANLPMAAFTRWFTGDTRGALKDSLAAIDAATKVGHRRAQAIAHHSAYFCLQSLGDSAAAQQHADASLLLARQLKARRFEAEALSFQAELHRLAGRRAEAIATIREALAISAETGMEYMGPIYYGILALAEEDETRCRAALAQGEAWLARNTVSHNHLLFRKDAIEACLELRDWDGAEHHASALEAFVRNEPMPWSSFIIARARALAAQGRGEHVGLLAAEFERLRGEGRRLGIHLPGLGTES